MAVLRSVRDEHESDSDGVELESDSGKKKVFLILVIFLHKLLSHYRTWDLRR